MKNGHLEPLIVFLKKLQVDSVRITSHEALWLQRCSEALEQCRLQHEQVRT